VKPQISRENLRSATIKIGRSHTWSVNVSGEPVTLKTWSLEEKAILDDHDRITITNEDYNTTFAIKNAQRKVMIDEKSEVNLF